MIVSFLYGDSEMSVDVADSSFGEVVELEDVTLSDISGESLRGRLLSGGIEQFLDNCGRLLLVVNDSFRTTPSSIALAAVREFVESARDVRLIVATGLHRKPTDAEVNAITGSGFDLPFSRLKYSDAYDDSAFDIIGHWKDGDAVRMNKLLGWADRVIVIGSVEPHYFAGYTGGPKSFLPGLSHHETVENNHKLAVDSRCQPCRLDGNPVAESIREAVSLLDTSKIFSIQFVTDPSGAVVDAFAGDLWKTFDEAVSCAGDIYLRPVKSKYGVVVAVNGPPLDRNLYQLQKAWENVRSVVADNGAIIVVSSCHEGVGNEEFFRLTEQYPDPDSILEVKPDRYRLGFHKLYRTAQLKQTVRLMVRSELDDATVKKVYLDPVHDIEKAVSSEVERIGNQCKVLFVKDAGNVVPYVDSAA